METLGNGFVAKNGIAENKNYCCIICDYSCSKKYNWTKHLSTDKHKKATLEISNGKKWQKVAKQCGNCGKFYETNCGLWKHKKKCIQNYNDQEIYSLKENNIENEICDKNLIMNLLKQNAELLEIIKNGTSTNMINSNNVNSNNKTFNLQVFLNETCKDAMNISDFIESVKLQVSDLENVGKVGYIEGISNIIIKNLQALEVEKRPVHCTDQKREVMYVKEDNIWEKEDEANKKLRKAIRSIAHKNICMLKAFREKYPDCEEYDSKKSSQYNKLVIEAMGGKGDNDYDKDTKIIKKIAKAVGIDKN
jgi:hypothetical protein